jgi:glycosyltransferase involved in cell wall biosynthesis
MGAVLLADGEARVKIRVLEVLATLKRAGAERMAVSLVRALDPDRFETGVVSLFDAFPEGLEPELAEARIRTWHLGKRPGLDPRMVPRLIGVFRGFRPSILHTHSYVLRYTLPAGVAARAGAMVHTVHNLAGREVDATGRLIHRFAFRGRVTPVVVAAEVGRSFRKLYGAEPAAVIPNGIETGRYFRPGARQEWRRANGFSADDLLIVSVARLEPQKNPLGLIESFARALGEERRWRLLMAGDGSLRNAAREAALRLGIGERVHFLGVRSDVAEILSASDVFALASHWEGNPIAVMEAMAAGLPVVATAVGGVPELVVHGETGLLAPAGDEQAFADALAAVAGDPERRRDLGAAGLRRSAGFGVDAMVASYSRLFERLAGGRP